MMTKQSELSKTFKIIYFENDRVCRMYILCLQLFR